MLGQVDIVQPAAQLADGERVEVFFGRGKNGDFDRGKVVNHLGGERYDIQFDDGHRLDMDLSPDADEVWRRPCTEPESEKTRAAAAAAAWRELQRRDRNVGLQQELDAHVRLTARLLEERVAHAVAVERLLARVSPPRMVEISTEARHGVVLTNGLVVLAPHDVQPLEAERVVNSWAEARWSALAAVPNAAVPYAAVSNAAVPNAATATDLGGSVRSAAEWLVDVFPFEMAERERLLDQTGLVAMAGSLDQEGAGDGMVRVIGDDFLFEHAPPLLINPLDGAPRQCGDGSETVRLTHVVWPQSSADVRCVAAPVADSTGATAEHGREHGGLRSSNLIVFQRPMPQGGCVASLGAPVEVVTGCAGWQIQAIFSPKRQAHCNALLGKGDTDGGATVRLVPFTTAREAAAVRRTRGLPVRSHATMREVVEPDLLRLQQLKPRAAPPTTSELIEGVSAAVLGPAAIATADGGTGGSSVNMGWRERVQKMENPVSTTALDMADTYVLRLRALHSASCADAVAELAALTAPVLGQAAEDLTGSWPSVLAALGADLHSAAYESVGGAFFPPRALQRAGRDADGPVLEVAELVVRINRVPSASERPSEEELIALMQQPCGLHSDACDTDKPEVIIYLHGATGESGGGGGEGGGDDEGGGGGTGVEGGIGGDGGVGGGEGGGCNSVARLGLQLRLRGGATLTRGQRKKKKSRTS